MVKSILRIEGALIFLTILYCYGRLQYSWTLFFLLLFVPDISMLGYLINKKIGSIAYNAVHNYILSVVLIGVGVMTKTPLMISIGMIAIAHVGMDRALGFGLKYQEDFKSTHIQRL